MTAGSQCQTNTLVKQAKGILRKRKTFFSFFVFKLEK